MPQHRSRRFRHELENQSIVYRACASLLMEGVSMAQHGM